MSDDNEHLVILFDGVCNLCNSFVNFVLDRDPQSRFQFAALQSPAAARLLTELGRPVPKPEPDTIVLVQNGTVYERSTAALRVARRLSGAWKLLYVFIIVPRPLRDIVYRFVARNRYRWFGRKDVCRVPTPELRARFLTT